MIVALKISRVVDLYDIGSTKCMFIRTANTGKGRYCCTRGPKAKCSISCNLSVKVLDEYAHTFFHTFTESNTAPERL